jgi:hypothetical protein
MLGRDKGGYYHELFLRNKRFLAHRITKVKVKGTGTRKPSSPETEPNFYAKLYSPDSLGGFGPSLPPLNAACCASAYDILLASLPKPTQPSLVKAILRNQAQSQQAKGRTLQEYLQHLAAPYNSEADLQLMKLFHGHALPLSLCIADQTQTMDLLCSIQRSALDQQLAGLSWAT